MLKSKKALQKTIDGQAQYIIELEETAEEVLQDFIYDLREIQDINNKPTPSRNNWKLRQKLINNKIEDIIRIYEEKPTNSLNKKERF